MDTWVAFISSVQFSRSVVSYFFDLMDCSTPGLPVHHQLLEFTQSHVHWVGNAIQPSHPLLSPSPPAFNLSQHQGLFQWVSSLHQVAKVLEFQLQHQSFQWMFRTDFHTKQQIRDPCCKPSCYFPVLIINPGPWQPNALLFILWLFTYTCISSWRSVVRHIMEDRDVNQKETYHGGAYSLRKDDKTCTQFRKKKRKEKKKISFQNCS